MYVPVEWKHSIPFNTSLEWELGTLDKSRESLISQSVCTILSYCKKKNNIVPCIDFLKITYFHSSFFENNKILLLNKKKKWFEEKGRGQRSMLGIIYFWLCAHVWLLVVQRRPSVISRIEAIFGIQENALHQYYGPKKNSDFCSPMKNKLDLRLVWVQWTHSIFQYDANLWCL